MDSLFTRLFCVAFAWFLAVGLGSHAGEATAQPTPPQATVQWRRTVNGWERADLWQVGSLSPRASQVGESTATAPSPPPEVHPIFVAAFLLAAAALMAVGTNDSAAGPRK